MKVLIIEDRKDRQEKHLGDELLSQLSAYEKQGVVVLQQSLPTKDEYAGYDVVAVHRSLLMDEDSYGQFIEERLRTKQKTILFSGGITQNIFLEDGCILQMNAQEFYSAKLIGFLEKCSSRSDVVLYEFLYGDNWELVNLMKRRFIIWRYKNEPPEEGDEFESEWISLSDTYGDMEKADKEIEKQIEKILKR